MEKRTAKLLLKESLHAQCGLHEVIDSVHKDRNAFKGMVEESEAMQLVGWCR
ncbi:MAG: hypothetical protein LBB81_09935 [Treponema sp.]|nr:hypothetical protein [Treponema sp.]